MSTFTIRVSSSSTNPAATAFGQQPDQGAPSYFDLVVSGSSDPAVRNGVYDAYCLNPVQTIFVATNYSAEGYAGNSAASFAPIGFSNFSQTHVDQINWLLAQNLTADAKYAGQYNFGEVQVAIWKILGFSDADIAATPTEFLNDNYRNTINAADADALVAAAQAAVASGNGVVPTDAFFTAIIDPAGNAQPLIVQLQSAKLGNFVWQDSNANGVQDQGEAGVDRVVVELYDGSGNFITSTLTGDDFSTAAVEHGYYQFAGLKAGDYQVKFVAPTYNFTVQDSAAPGATDSNDSDANTLTGLSHVVSLAAGESNQTIDAGLVQKPVDPLPAKLSGYVYEDFGNDGVRGNGEPALAGVTITLAGTNDLGQSVSVVTTTNAAGFYEFTGLRPGTYTVTEAPQPGAYLDGKDTAGSSGGNTSTNDVISNIVLTSGANSVDNNFGELVGAQIRGFVYGDANDDGIKQPGDVGLGGVTLNLVGVNDLGQQVTATTTTNADGSYLFAALRPGTYTVTEATQPAGYLDGKDTAGFPGGGSAGNEVISNIVLTQGLISNDNNFGEILPAKLSGFVYQDQSNDGVKDSGEAGIANVTVRLTGTDDKGAAVSLSTSTNANGFYEFTNLRPGTYTVTETQPAAFIDGKDTAGSTGGTVGNDVISQVVLTAGANSQNNNFGELVSASLGDRLWVDANGNGQQDGGEAGVVGATVTLIGGGADGVINGVGDTTATTTTGADGNYAFTGLNVGEQYQVQFTAPTGAVFTTANQGNDASDSDADAGTGKTQIVTLASGENNTTLDAGVYTPGSVGDKVFEDKNADGHQDGNEPGIDGVTVRLYNCVTNQLIATQVTANGGQYNFTGLPPGTYHVVFETPNGFVQTVANVGNDASDSDAGVGGKTACYTLSSGQTETTVDAGFYRTASLGDYVWLDNNNNGQQDDGAASGLNGVTVNLRNAVGTVVATTTTANDSNGHPGHYLFTSLVPGDYSVEFVKPAGYSFAKQDQGSDGSDSDANTSTGRTITTTLESGENDLSWDAGLVKLASLGDRLWVDANGNGQQDGGEAGVVGATVTLIGGGADGVINGVGDTTATTTTGADGKYAFTGLNVGEQYQVQFTAPTAAVFTTANLGNDASDSDADASTGKTQIVTLAAGENNTTLDAGVYTKAKLGDFVWEDKNANGVQDADDLGIAGVQVDLKNTSGAVIATTTTDANGKYSFDVAPGTYAVAFVDPAGYVNTVRDAGGNDAADSDAAFAFFRGSQTVSQSGAYTLASGETNLTIDAGYYKKASLGDYVWLDNNNNGQQDDGVASGLNGVTVNLRDGAGAVIATTTTANDGTGNPGYYRFTNLVPGDYSVEFVKPAGYAFAKQDQGADGVDSDANTSTGRTITTTLESGENDLSWDAGLVKLASLGDRLWVDANGNGQQDGGEVGVVGATVTLIGGGADGVINGVGDTTATTTTGADGKYAFTGLNVGEQYQVQFTAPTGAVFTTANQGNDVSDSDADASTGKTQIVTLAAGDNNTTLDAGVYTPASLGDKVFEDKNADGHQDANEPGIDGVTVRLYNCVTNQLIATQVTANGGQYNFTGLPPGTYHVVFETPNGFVQTVANVGNDASDSDAGVGGKTACYTLSSGQTDTTVDAGFYKTASLGDYVWLDNNNNGAQDDGAANGLNGVTVNLRNGAGAVIATTTTANDGTGNPGYYLFTNLVPGDYSVEFVKPAGYNFAKQDLAGGNDAADSDANTSTGRTITTTLVSGENDLSWDAGLVKLASLGDRLWTDTNANGQQDAGETGVVGATVTLIGGGADGVINGVGDTVATTTTGANGIYAFTGLNVGEQYQVQFAAPAGTVFTTANQGNDLSDSDADATTGKTQIVTLAAGENNTTLDAGVFAKASLGDRVWFDANGNGVQDSGETGRAGVTVNLLNASGTVVATQTTAADGSYLFGNLTPGSYSVEFVAPSGYRFTSKDAGADAADSDADTISGRTGTYVLSSGESNTTVDAGLIKCLVTLGDRVWLDTNANGLQDSGENGVANVKVTLVGAGADGTLGTADDTQRSTTTDSTGMYKFEGVEHGTYKLRFDTPANYQITAANVGNDDAKDSDVTKVVVKGTTNLITNGSFENGSSGWTGNGDSIEVGHFNTYGVTGATGNAVVELDANACGPSGFYQDVATTAGQAYQLSVDIAARANTALATNTVEVFWGGVKIATIDPTSTAFKTYTFDVTGTGGNNRLEFREQAGDDEGLGGMIDNVRLVTCTTVTETAPVIVDTCADNLTIDAGLVADKASIGNFIWYDKNANGIQDSGETGVAGVTVELRDNSGTYGNVVATTTTDANGKYLFSNLNPGDYHIDVQENTLPAGFVFTKPDQGGNDNVDSDVFSTASQPLSYGIMANTTLDAGENDLSWDAGVYKVGIDVEKYVSGTISKTGNNGGSEGASCNDWKDSCSTTTSRQWVNNAWCDVKTPSGNGWSGISGCTGKESFNQIFGCNVAGGSKSIYDVLCSTGTSAVEKCMRESVAAYLNACHDKVDYCYSKDQVIAHTKWGMESGKYDECSKAYEQENNKGCDWGNSKTNWDCVVATELYDADAPPGLEVKAGSAVTFTYIVKNTGDTALKNVVLTDDRIATVTYVSGDTDKDGLLDTNETWTYTATEVAQTGTIKNTGTVTAVDSVGGVASVTDKDDAYYTGTGAAKSSLGDRVWEDSNGNGVQDSGEKGLAGVKVTLTGAGKDGTFGTGDDITATTTTGSNGLYEFNNLDAGKYTVKFGTLTGYNLTAADQGSNDAKDSDANTSTRSTGVITLAAGEHNLTVDAGMVGIAKLGIDVEKYVSGTISKTSNNGGNEGASCNDWKNSCATSSSRQWVSSGWGGSWVDVKTPTGWSGISGVTGKESFNQIFGCNVAGGSKSIYDVLCSTGTSSVDKFMRESVSAYLNASHDKVDYAYSKDQVLANTKWGVDTGRYDDCSKAYEQENNKGCDWGNSKTNWDCVVATNLYDADAPPGLEVKAGSTVTFTYIVKNTGDTALKNVVLTDDRIATVTYVSGDTDKDGLLDTNETWTYTATEVAQTGTIKNTGTVTGIDANGSGRSVTDKDDAYYTGSGAAKASLGDRVWEDRNGNGVQDGGEAGLSGVKVTLTGAGKDGTFGTKDDITATTTTNANGLYEFNNLDAGKYKLKFDAASGYLFTKQDQAGNDASDSDVNSSGATGEITLDANEHDLTVDAGLYRKASVGDRVWEDSNHNNLQDAGEAGIANITVKLLSSSGAVLATTTTNASGNYLFSNLDPGAYQLQFDKTNVSYKGANMSNWKWAVKDVGSNDAIDSDVTGNATATTNVTVTSQFTLDSGESDMTRDAGITPIVIDLNGNGIHTVARADAQGTFDLLGNGKAVASGWLSGDDGFLAVDANGNGKIDGIHELFGGSSKGDGFAKLASFDSNGDGLVNDLDSAFGQLLIWRDANGNHGTDAGELMSLADAGVASLTVAYTELPQLDAQGNLHLERSTATLADGQSVAMTDVYFNVSADDAAAAGVALPTMADLLGNDRSLDSLLGATPQSLGGLKEDDAAAAGAGDSAEVLRRLAALSRENCHASVAA